jgi:hypothetical protein
MTPERHLAMTGQDNKEWLVKNWRKQNNLYLFKNAGEEMKTKKGAVVPNKLIKIIKN